MNAPPAALSTVVPRPGRRLRLSPDWDGDARVVFDASSGDFWVVNAEVAALMDGWLVSAAATKGGGDATPLQLPALWAAELVTQGLLDLA